MKERAIDRERAIVAHHQTAKIPEPGVGAFDDPSSPVAPQRSAILRRGPDAILLVRADQFDPALPQALAQRIAVVCFVGDHPQRFLPWTTCVMTPPYADRGERRFREFDFRRGCRVKVLSQRKTAAVDHHHPLRPLAPLGFSDSAAPFFAEAKLPSRNDSLHFNCWRSFNSLRNVRQMLNQTPRSSQSRSRRQHVEGCGNFSGRSCQRAPLRRIHKIPSSTRRFSIHGRPPLRCLGGLGSKGAIFFHCASVSNGPHRAIGPPSALLTFLISHFGILNHSHFNGLFRVVQQLLVVFASESVYKNTQNKLQYAKNRWNAATDLFGRHERMGCCNFMRMLSGFERLLLLGGLLLVAAYAAAASIALFTPLRHFEISG
jgi:hypothetical protein